MTTIAEAYVQLKPSMRGFASDMNNQVGSEMSSIGDRHGKSYGGAFGSAFKAIGGIMIIKTIADIGIEAIKTGLSTAASMEQAKIAFTTMLGSAEKADGFLKQLADFAAQTPFEFPELQTAASSLISSGVAADKVIPIMRTLGNVTSGMGTGSDGVKRATVALQQMQAAGKITAENLNQLRDAGIPVYELLAKATGKSTAEVTALASAGKLGKKELDQMMSALETGKGLEKFNGLMEAQSQSLSGLASTFKDNLGMGLAKAVEPLIPLLKDGLGKTADWLGNVAMPALAKGFQWVVDVGTAFSDWLGKGDMNKMSDVLAATFGGASTDQLMAFEDGLIGVQTGVTTTSDWITTQLVPALKSIGDWIMTNIAPSVMEMVGAFQRAYDVIAPIVTQLVTGIMEKVGPMLPTIMGIFQGIGSIIASVFSIVASVVRFIFDDIKAFWEQWGGAITSFVSNTFGGIINLLAGWIDWVSGAFKAVSLALKGDWGGAFEAMKTATSEATAHIRSALSDFGAAIWAVIKEVGVKIGDEFKKMWEKASEVGSNIAQGIANGISAGIQWVVDAAKKVAGAALQAVKDFLGIKSPSTVMEDQVGFQIPAGVARGITGGGGLIDSAMNDLAARAVRPIGISAAGSYGLDGSSPNGMIPAVYVQNPFTGEYLLAQVSTAATDVVRAQTNEYAWRA